MPTLPYAISTGWSPPLARCAATTPTPTTLVQEVYLTLLRRPRRLKNGSEIAYLMTMLRNAQIDRFRATARR